MSILGTTKFYKILSLFVALLAASLLAGCGTTTPAPPPFTPGAIAAPVVSTAATSARIAVGAPVPDFTVQTLEGQPLQISALRGKALIINYWAVY